MSQTQINPAPSLSHSDHQFGSKNEMFHLYTYFNIAMRNVKHGHTCGCAVSNDDVYHADLYRGSVDFALNRKRMREID